MGVSIRDLKADNCRFEVVKLRQLVIPEFEIFRDGIEVLNILLFIAIADSTSEA